MTVGWTFDVVMTTAAHSACCALSVRLTCLFRYLQAERESPAGHLTAVGCKKWVRCTGGLDGPNVEDRGFDSAKSQHGQICDR